MYIYSMDSKKYFDSAKVSEKTLKTYHSLYVNHLKQYEKSGLIPLKDVEKNADKILKKEISNNTIMTILSLYINIMIANGIDETKVKEKHRNLFDKKKSDTMERKSKKNSLPSYDELISFNNHLYKKQEWLSYIVSFLLTNYVVRNEDIDVKIIDNIKQNNGKDNYILLRKTDCVYIRNRYKTFKNYGVKKIVIRSKKFRNAIIEFIKKINESGKSQLYEDGILPLFTSNSNLTQTITNHTYQHITESDIAKIVVSNVDLNKNMKEIDRISNSRGTTRDVLLSEYRLSDRT